jgi:hypothetical protein
MNHYNLVKAFGKTDEIINEVDRSKKLNVIVPSSTMSGNPVYFKDHMHTTAQGSEKLARIISENLLNIIK